MKSLTGQAALFPKLGERPSRMLWLRALANATFAILICCCPTGAAQETERNGPWLVARTPDGAWTSTAEMTLHAAAEPQPALLYRLTPDAFDQVDGNSALYYLKAMAFLEQGPAAERIRELEKRHRAQADKEGWTDSSVPPEVWLEMAPQQLPLAEVKEYLGYSSFQEPLMVEAARRTKFSLDRNIRQVESPISVLLPEIQSIRNLARVQSLRCRLAIAEHRIADAITILHQQFTLARHLGSDEFLVSNLVGAAIISISMQDMVYLLQEPNTPNLYWAFAALPKPIIDMNEALSLERQFTSMQLKALQDVDEAARPAGYWQEFTDRILPQVRNLGLYDTNWIGSDPQTERAAFVSLIASAYPGAKRYLLEECRLDKAKVETYPTAQVVFLAMKRFNERNVDESFKWLCLPYEQASLHPRFLGLDKAGEARGQRVGWLSAPGIQMLSAIKSIRVAQVRVQQQIGLCQTIEAIRMYAADHAGKLPTSLADLPYPAPNDPVAGKPFQYELASDMATLKGESLPYLQYRLKLRMAK